MDTIFSPKSRFHINAAGVILVFWVQFLAAQDFAGRYHTQSGGGGITLELRSNGAGGYSGALQGNGNSFAVQGTLQNGILSGIVGNELEGIVFQAQWQGEQLNFTMMETDENGNPAPATARALVFQRQDGENPPGGAKKQEKPVQVIINNQALSEAQIAELEKTYGVRPRPGNYWYDARSGLYGVVGYQAYGFMQPGHSFGTLAREVSNGNTGVLINGRELPMGEYTVWSYIVGSWIQPGAYWLDANGNAGYEGNPLPVINLYAAAQQNAYRGQGGSGDNFWSTRFSAGNYNADNSQGYVSVPGYGPVGYGF